MPDQQTPPESPPPNPLSETITVTVEGDDYEFAIPSIVDEMKVGMRMRDIRRRINPNGDISDFGLDQSTLYFNRACAAFELLLRRTSASPPWPFSAGSAGPEVNCEKFPREKAATVIAVYGGLQEKLLSFRK